MIRHHDDLLRTRLRHVSEGRLSRRKFLASAVAAAFALPMAERAARPGQRASAAPARQDEPMKGGQVIVGLSQEPTIFNPLKSTLEVDRGVQFALFDSLWRIDQDAVLVPNLATEIPTLENGGISEDGLTYTFKLRDDAKWHDGEPFTAADVVFSHNTIVNPDFVRRQPHRPRPGDRDLGSRRLHGDDDAQGALRALPDRLGGYLSRAGAPAEGRGRPQHRRVQLDGAGRHRTVHLRRAASRATTSTLAANPNYHGPGPYLDTVIFKYVQDLTVLFTQFKTGEVDVTGIQGITADNYEEAQTLEEKVINRGQTGFVEFIYMNHGNPVFQDKAVREALYYAMDKENIINTVYYGVHTPSETYLPEKSWAIQPRPAAARVYNVDKAKEILDAAGWMVGADGIREKDGVKLSFTNSTTAGNKVREQAQQYLQQTWERSRRRHADQQHAAGGDLGRLLQQVGVRLGDGRLDTGLGADPDGDDAASTPPTSRSQGGGGQNTMQYKNPELDKLWKPACKRSIRRSARRSTSRRS